MKIDVGVLEECCNLEPHIVWQKKQMEKNQHIGHPYNIEANGLRQTGRTTNMLLKAISRCSDNHNVTIYVKTEHYRNLMIEKIENILTKVPTLGWKKHNGFIFIGSNYISFQIIGNSDVLFDESINDTFDW